MHPVALVATGARGAADMATLDPGQLAYVAPEQLGGSGSEGLDDVYGVSVLLHRLLTGALPYDDSMAIGRYLKNRLTTMPGAVVGPHHAADADLAAVRAVVADGLSLDPALRPRDLDELADRVLAALRPDDPDAAVAALLATGLVDASVVAGRPR